MWNSITLKRSMVQIGKSKALRSAVENPCRRSLAGKSLDSRRSWSSEPTSSMTLSSSPYWENFETAVDANDDNGCGSSTTNDSGTDDIKSNHGIIRYTMTPKARQRSRHSSSTRGFGTTLDRDNTNTTTTASSSAPITEEFFDEKGRQQRHLLQQQLPGDEVVEDTAVYYDPMYQQNAAEQMAKLMNNSYYYASYKARGSPEEMKKQ